MTVASLSRVAETVSAFSQMAPRASDLGWRTEPCLRPNPDVSALVWLLVARPFYAAAFGVAESSRTAVKELYGVLSEAGQLAQSPRIDGPPVCQCARIQSLVCPSDQLEMDPPRFTGLGGMEDVWTMLNYLSNAPLVHQHEKVAYT